MSLDNYVTLLHKLTNCNVLIYQLVLHTIYARGNRLGCLYGSGTDYYVLLGEQK